MRGRKQLTITLPNDLADYLDKKVADRTFANKSHAIEVCVLRYKEAEEGRAAERME